MWLWTKQHWASVSQSVKTSHVGGPRHGFDGGELVKGRKRHIVTDTLGLLLAVVVHSASLSDSQQAPHVLKRLERTFAWLGGYRRLSKDYEYLPEVSEAMVQLAAICMTYQTVF